MKRPSITNVLLIIIVITLVGILLVMIFNRTEKINTTHQTIEQPVEPQFDFKSIPEKDELPNNCMAFHGTDTNLAEIKRKNAEHKESLYEFLNELNKFNYLFYFTGSNDRFYILRCNCVDYHETSAEIEKRDLLINSKLISPDAEKFNMNSCLGDLFIP